MLFVHEFFVFLFGICQRIMWIFFDVFGDVISVIQRFVPSQYWVLVLLYLGFLSTVLLVNIFALILKWLLLWVLRRN